MHSTSADIAAARIALARLAAAPAPQPVSRATFSAWDPERQSLFCKAGGTIIPDPKPPRRAPLPPSPPCTVADLKKSAAADAQARAEYRAQLR